MELSIEKRKSIPKDEWYRKYYWDLRKNVWNCSRDSYCKYIDTWEIKSSRFAKVCPSSLKYLFDAYSCQGRMDIALALIDGELKYEESPQLLDIFYKCDTCGGCDVSCKRGKDMEPLRVLLEMRAKLVEDGWILPGHKSVIDRLKKKDSATMKLKAKQGTWFEGLNVKDLSPQKAEVLFYLGCQFSHDKGRWKWAKMVVNLLKNAGFDVGIMGEIEACCGARAYDIGYRREFKECAQNNIKAWANAGVKIIVTPCADCYYAFKILYPEYGSEFKVLHTVEIFDSLINEGKLKFSKAVPITVTFHDSCHIGRRAHIYKPGTPIMGLYEEPRNILRAIPGMELVEMERVKEFAWCCGAGGGVREAYPDFSMWTAMERIEEARSTGAEALVTSCPWCESNFTEALTVNGKGAKIKVFDIIELIQQAI